jgi:hypothetical protein
MPHKFEAHPDHPAVNYLVRLHADIGGRIQANKAEAAKLAADMKAVETVINLFDPAYDCRRIAVRRRRPANPWFKRGTLFRSAIDVLRKATAPLTAREIMGAVLAARGITSATDKQRRDLEGGIRASLENNVGKGVERVGDGMPRRWRLLL